MDDRNARLQNVDWSEYWKSLPKKFCDFCKCWTADNKASVEFHEKGKRHQENVKKKIEDLRKKATQDAMKKQEDENDMQRMEKAALEAFKKDLIDNPDLAAHYKVRVKPQTDETPACGPEPRPEGIDSDADSHSETDVKTENDEKSRSLWLETLSPESYSYYWNTETNEVSWVKPSSYISLDEQKGNNKEQTTTSTKDTAKIDKLKKKDRRVTDAAEKHIKSTAKLKEETIKSESIQKADAAESEELTEHTVMTVANRPIEPSVYGTWESVKVEQEEDHMIDLQLPQPTTEEIPLPSFTQEEKPKIKFREKTVSSLADDATKEYVAFKKRKLGTGSRNMRQRDSK